MNEYLVILASDNHQNAEAARRELTESGYDIRQSYGEHVLLVESSRKADLEFESHPGVVGIYDGRVPEEISAHLDETSKLGISAWNQRKGDSFRAAKLHRKGEGLSWDHPDFEREG